MIAQINFRPDLESPVTDTIERTVPAFWPIPQVDTNIVVSHHDNPTAAEGELNITAAKVTEVTIFYNDKLEPTFVEIEAS